MDVPIIPDAQHRYLAQHSLKDLKSYISVGMIALGLEIETRARIAERFGDDLFEIHIGSHVAESLRNALDAMGIRDEVIDEYDRQVRVIRAERGVSHVASPSDSDDASVLDPAIRDADHPAPGRLDVALDRSSLLDAVDVSWQAVGNDPSAWVLFAEPGLTIEGYEEVESGEYRSHARSDADPD